MMILKAVIKLGWKTLYRDGCLSEQCCCVVVVCGIAHVIDTNANNHPEQILIKTASRSLHSICSNLGISLPYA
jgi:hypothetical protein